MFSRSSRNDYKIPAIWRQISLTARVSNVSHSFCFLFSLGCRSTFNLYVCVSYGLCIPPLLSVSVLVELMPVGLSTHDTIDYKVWITFKYSLRQISIDFRGINYFFQCAFNSIFFFLQLTCGISLISFYWIWHKQRREKNQIKET